MKAAAAFVGVASALDAQPSFEDWKDMFNIETNGDDATMKETYEANVAHMSKLEKDHPDATFGVNQFSGMTFAEFSARMLTATPPEDSDLPVLDTMAESDVQLTDVNWDVTPVKDQGSCGSCWAFGTFGNVEHLHKLSTGSTVSLAEQQLVDCSKQNNGCSGGRPDWALTYLAGKSIYTTSSYPYTARDGTCSSGTASGVTVTGYSRVSKSDSALASALGTSAITVLVYADSAFQSYRSGVLTAPTTCNLNHAVLATGYSSSYWKIKNSWGSSWGDNGFVRMTRGKNICGINSGPNAPLFDSSVAV